jgi:hypothetical protein
MKIQNLFQLSAVCRECGSIEGVCVWALSHEGKEWTESLCYECAGEVNVNAGIAKAESI